MTSEVTPVLVGDKLFYIHTDVLVSSSAFLRNSMKPEWRTDASEPVDLSDEDPCVFESYSQWLYARQIISKADHADDSLHLARLYILGEQLIDSVFQDVIIDTFIRHASNSGLVPCAEAVNEIYERTQDNSPARRLMVDLWAFGASPTSPDVDNVINRFSDDFIGDLFPALLKRRPEPDNHVLKPWIAQPRIYHCGDDAEKEVKKPKRIMLKVKKPLAKRPLESMSA